MGKSERHLSLIKLPLGINRKNNRRCLFLNPDNHPVVDPALLLKTIKKNSGKDLIRILDAEDGETPGAEQPVIGAKDQIGQAIGKMINSCKVINHLIAKARDTNYLNHYERMCLLYTLSFAGEDGCAVLHKAISHCINYDYQYTQRQIERRKESPMSCAKIMENFPELAETLPCACKFKLPPRSYPSPILYLLESEIESADPGALPLQPGGEYIEGAKRDAPSDKPEETGNKQARLLDFDTIFSEESALADDAGEAGSEAPGTSSVEALDPGNITPNGRARGNGYREWENEVPGHAREDEQQSLDESAFQGPAICGNSLSDLNPACGQPEKNDELEAVGSAPPAGPPGGAGDKHAWELMLRYLGLRHSKENIRRRLESVCSELDTLFDRMEADTLETPMGSIRRIRNSGGESSWVITTEN